MKAKLNPTAWWSPSTVTPICEVSMSATVQQLQTLVERMASMLCDLHNNFGWDELGDSLEGVLEEARQMGCHVEDEGDE